MLHKERIVDCGQNIELLGALAKLRKATLSFVMSVCPSVRPSVRMEQLGFHSRDFHEI
jgi:hypothetical protein